MDKHAMFENVRGAADTRFTALARRWKEMLQTQQMIEGDQEGKEKALRRVAQAMADAIVASLGTHTLDVPLIDEFISFLHDHYLAQREVLSPVADDVRAQLEAFGREQTHDESERNLANAYRDQINGIIEGRFREGNIDVRQAA